MLWLESESEIATRSEAIARKRDFLKKNPAINGEDSCLGAVAGLSKASAVADLKRNKP